MSQNRRKPWLPHRPTNRFLGLTEALTCYPTGQAVLTSDKNRRPWEEEAYNVVVVRRSVYACRHCGSPLRTAFRRVLNALQACRHHDNRHTNKVPETDALPVGHVANKGINREAIFDFSDQLSPCSLCLFITSSENKYC